MKMLIVEKDERKTPTRVPAACGYLKMEMKWPVETLLLSFDDSFPFDRVAVMIYAIPANHRMPLKIDTTHKLINPSEFRSM